MKKYFSILVAVLLLMAFVGDELYAQKVNFSGTWKFNQDKSKFPDMGDRGGRRGGGFTSSWLSTRWTPGINIASIYAARRAAKEGTVPVRTTFPSDTATITSEASTIWSQ